MHRASNNKCNGFKKKQNRASIPRAKRLQPRKSDCTAPIVVVCFESVAGSVAAVNGGMDGFGQPVRERNEFTCIDNSELTVDA